MTPQEKIAEFESELLRATSAKERAKLLIGILDQYSYLQSKDLEPYIQELLHLAESEKNSDYLANAHYYMGNLHRFNEKFPEAITEVLKAVDLLSSGSDTYLLGSCYNNLGFYYYSLGKYAESLSAFKKLLEIKESDNDKRGIGHAQNNIGNIHRAKGDFAAALSSFFNALRFREEVGDREGVSHTLNNIAAIYDLQGNQDESLKYHFQSLKIKEELGIKTSMAASFNNIAKVFISKKDYAEASAYQEKALKIYQDVGNKTGMAISWDSMGVILMYQDNYDSAATYFQTALSLCEELLDENGVARCCTNLGNAFTKLGQFEIADTYLNRAFQITQEIGAKDLGRDVLKAYYLLKKEGGDHASALDYHEKYIEADKEIANEEVSKKIAALEYGYHIEKKEQEVHFERQKRDEIAAAYDLLDKEKQISESLLLNILPSEVAEELKQKGKSEAKLFDEVTVLFTDFKGFTTISEQLSPQQLVDELHECFKAFDDIMEKYGIEKIKTVGDAYLAAAGLPVPNPSHADDIIMAALEVRDFMIDRQKKLGSLTFEMRVGLHSGKVVAGIVGVKKFAYDIWGDTVNTAARMEQNGEVGKVNVSEATYELIKDKFTCTYRGEIEAKNKGALKMYFVER